MLGIVYICIEREGEFIKENNPQPTAMRELSLDDSDHSVAAHTTDGLTLRPTNATRPTRLEVKLREARRSREEFLRRERCLAVFVIPVKGMSQQLSKMSIDGSF